MLKILVIDDLKSWVALMQNYLKKAGYEPVSAETGQTGLRLAHDINPDLILLDWYLGGDISGLEVLKILKTDQDTKTIPIIMMSSVRQEAEDEADARQTGADVFLTKEEILKDGRVESVLLRRIQALLICNKPDNPATKDLRDTIETETGIVRGKKDARRTKFSIFMIDDDPEFLDYARQLLESRGYVVNASETGNKTVEKIKRARANLAILDFALPGMTGLEVCRQLKSDSATRAIPTMILTARVNKQNWLASIRSGADLFCPKPIKPEEFLQSVEALLHRIAYERADGGKITAGVFVIDPATHTVIINGREFPDLTTKPFDLAYLLAQNRPRIMSRKAIMSRMKIPLVRDNEINVLVHQLRRHLRPLGAALFKSSRGQGYFFDDATALAFAENPPEPDKLFIAGTK